MENAKRQREGEAALEPTIAAAEPSGAAGAGDAPDATEADDAPGSTEADAAPREGDRPAGSEWFEDAVMDLLPDLMSGALGMADGRADAEDLVHEAIGRAWERRETLRDRDRFRGWIFRIMKNCFLSRRRREDARPDEVPLPGEGDDQPSFSLFERLHQPVLLWWGNPEDRFLDRLLKEDIERALEEIPDVYRAAVVLADVQGFKYAEIAEILEVPVGTVRSRLARGRSLLQEALWTHAVDAGLRTRRSDEAEGDEGGPTRGDER